MDNADFQARARRAYERGRLGAALPLGAAVLPLAALSSNCCASPIFLFATASVLAVTVVALVWRGETYAAGARAGILAGAAAWALPVLGRTCGPDGLGGSPMLALCFAGGLFSALLVAWKMRARGADRVRFFAVACGVAWLLGSLGCVVAGVGGLFGMILGAVVAGVPVVLTSARVRS